MEIIVRTGLENLKKNMYNDADSYIFGLDGLSIDRNLISFDELKDIDTSKIYLALDKNIFNSDLTYLEDVLGAIDSFNLKGILFYDLSVLSISKRLGVKTPLIWNQNFFVTNYGTCNYYKKEGVSGALLSSTITKDEMIEISKNTSLDLFVNMFGYELIAFSKRHLISNYFSFIDEEYEDGINYMSERAGVFPTVQKDFGTKIFNKDVLCGIRYINDFKPYVKHIILDDNMIDMDVFVKVLSIFKGSLDVNDDALLDKERDINSLINTSLGFFDKKTIYKVKRK